MPKMTPLLEVKNLVKTFKVGTGLRKTSFNAVNDISFAIPSGTSFGLVGESGSGKSTAARMVTRLIEPTSGQVIFDGQDITGLKGDALMQYRRSVQMIFQDPFSALNPRMTVEEIITEPWLVHKLHSKADRKLKALALIDQVGLPSNSLERKPVEFSGGQRQRILIARALTLEPKLLVADEPVSALDVLIQAQILNLLKDLQKELGLTYLFISHDLSVVEFISDQIGVMYRGNLVELGDKTEIYRNPKNDYTRNLLAAIPSEETSLFSRSQKNG